jgi:hypothetical protein
MFQSLRLVDYLNLGALALSPLIAVLVSMWIQSRREKRQQRLSIFQTLMATRHATITDENVRALNMIDVVFYNSLGVRRLWRDYLEMLSNEGLNNATGWATRQKKRLELVTEMASVLGYGKAISHLDVDRVYYPVGLGAQNKKVQELLDEFLLVLRQSHSAQSPPTGPTLPETPKTGA